MPWSETAARCHRHLAVLPRLMAMGLLLCVASVAVAQSDPAPNLTPEALIGDSVSEPNSDRYSDVAEAIKRFKNRDPLSARSFLERAVQKDPKLPPVGVLTAKMQLLAGNSQAVRPALEQAVLDDSANDPEPFLLLAEEALAGNRIIEADALFDKAVALIEGYNENPKRKRQFVIRAHRGRAVVSQRREKWDQAESDLRMWLEQDPDNASARMQLGQALFMRGEDREGYESFVAAKQNSDELPEPYVSAALMYDKLGKTAEAMQAFERAFSKDANNSTTLLAYAQALVKSRDVQKAESVLDQARISASDSLNVWLLSGVVSQISGERDAAEEHYLRALSLSPSNRDVINQLAQLLSDSPDEEDNKRAAQFASLNAKINPNNPDVNMTLAWVLFQNGQVAAANQALGQAIQGGAMSADGQFLFAKMMLAARNDKETAKKLLEASLKNDRGIFVQREQAEALLATL